jgi:hypothetical protein
VCRHTTHTGGAVAPSQTRLTSHGRPDAPYSSGSPARPPEPERGGQPDHPLGIGYRQCRRFTMTARSPGTRTRSLPAPPPCTPDWAALAFWAICWTDRFGAGTVRVAVDEPAGPFARRLVVHPLRRELTGGKLALWPGRRLPGGLISPPRCDLRRTRPAPSDRCGAGRSSAAHTGAGAGLRLVLRLPQPGTRPPRRCDPIRSGTPRGAVGNRRVGQP